jgi:LmbE family N-acetylglucosaminyl deacetylase
MAEEQEVPGAWAQKILVVMAHPDDPEFSCGGTMAKWAAEGKEIVYGLFTRGDKGSGDPAMTSERLAPIREQEQRNAARTLGVKDVVFLGHGDGEVEDTPEGRGQVVRLIRIHKPDILVTMDPHRRYTQHRDHRNAAIMAMDATFPYARDYLHYPQHRAEGLEPHKVGEVFITGPDEPEFFIDVNDYLDKKIEALLCHRSQVGEDRTPEEMAERMKMMSRRFNNRLPEGVEPGTVEAFRRIDYRRR